MGVKDAVKRAAAGVVGSVEGVETTAKEFVLTYDDGPDPKYTPGILDVLAERQATATFFVLMTKVRKNPSLLSEIVAAGHEVGLHGIDHARLTDFKRREVLQRTRHGREELEDHLGKSIKWFRPPYGAQTPATWSAVRRAGLTPVVWGATMWDWKQLPHEQHVQKAIESRRKGVIILGHDSYPGPDDGGRTIEDPGVDRSRLARDVLTAYADEGLQARSLSATLRSGKVHKTAWFSEAF